MFDEDQKLFTVLIYKWLHTTHALVHLYIVLLLISVECHIKENNNNNNNNKR